MLLPSDENLLPLDHVIINAIMIRTTFAELGLDVSIALVVDRSLGPCPVLRMLGMAVSTDIVRMARLR